MEKERSKGVIVFTTLFALYVLFELIGIFESHELYTSLYYKMSEPYVYFLFWLDKIIPVINLCALIGLFLLKDVFRKLAVGLMFLDLVRMIIELPFVDTSLFFSDAIFTTVTVTCIFFEVAFIFFFTRPKVKEQFREGVKMGRKSIATTIFVAIILLVLAILIVSKMLLFTEEEFTVNESEQVIITQLGKYVRTIKEPGIYSKVPTQSIHRFKSEILEFNISSFKFTTKDNKRLVLDTHVRWKIEDPLRFYQRVGDNKYIAQARLEDIVLSETRKELALHTQSEVISINQELIMDNVGKQCNEMAKVYGIRVIDVSIKRADLL